jgi:hypothetical protein
MHGDQEQPVARVRGNLFGLGLRSMVMAFLAAEGQQARGNAVNWESHSSGGILGLTRSRRRW